MARQEFIHRASEKLDLPAEIIAGSPRIEVVGNGRIEIENHKGLLEYTEENIDVLTTSMTLRLRGRGLEIRAMNERELLITGELGSIEFVV